MATRGLDNGSALGSGEVEERYYEKELETTDGTIKLVTTDTNTHINIIIKDKRGNLVGSVSVRKPEALELQSTLNDMFPVEPEPQPYEVALGYMTSAYTGERERTWDVFQNEPSTQRKIVTHAEDKETALKIAKALNEAEGL